MDDKINDQEDIILTAQDCWEPMLLMGKLVVALQPFQRTTQQYQQDLRCTCNSHSAANTF